MKDWKQSMWDDYHQAKDELDGRHARYQQAVRDELIELTLVYTRLLSLVLRTDTIQRWRFGIEPASLQPFGTWPGTGHVLLAAHLYLIEKGEGPQPHLLWCVGDRTDSASGQPTIIVYSPDHSRRAVLDPSMSAEHQLATLDLLTYLAEENAACSCDSTPTTGPANTAPQPTSSTSIQTTSS